jgi:nucleoid DNA-binding protein/nucleoid-associated protein YgaU
MNQKKTLSHIVDLLVAKYDMDREDATNFVRGMFELIEEALITEKFVKVKGLGTFKLIDVESRESVDVRTGERIEIQGHRKISFIPETALRDLINKPFAHFENVVLNENTELPDTEIFVEDSPEGDSSAEDAAEEAAEVETPVVNAPVEEVVEAVEEVEAQVPEVETPAVEETPSVEETSSVEDTPLEEEPPVEETPSEEEIPAEEEKIPAEAKAQKAGSHKWLPLLALFVALFLLGFGVTRFLVNKSENEESPVTDSTEQPAEEEKFVGGIENSDTMPEAGDVPVGYYAPIDSVKEAEEAKQKVAEKTEVKTTAEKTETKAEKPASTEVKKSLDYYQIVGTKATHTLKEGETLRIIAEKYYGNRNLSKYIVMHNPSVITNPDLVPVGTKLEIPELKARE